MTISIEMTEEMADNLRSVLAKNDLTIEQAINFFLRWCIENPEKMKQWYEDNKYLLEADDGLVVEILE